MQWLDYDELETHALRFNEAVWDTPEIDCFCSSTYWALPAARHLSPNSRPFIFEGASNFGAMMTIDNADGFTTAVPLECGWGLASPLVGKHPDQAAGLLASAWLTRPDINGMILAGLPARGLWLDALVNRFHRQCRIGLGESCVRRIAKLDGGIDGFMSRRSKRFRANLRRSRRTARERGVVFESHVGDDPQLIYERIITVEKESWKGRNGDGFDQSPGQEFYEEIIDRLHRAGALRVTFARLEDRDIAFVVGAVMRNHYRGLQLSYNDDFRPLSLGNCVQLEMIENLCDEKVDSYDLGTDMPYKARWGEQTFETSIIALMPN